MVDLGALLPLIVSNTLNALGALLILLIGLWLSGRVDRLEVTMLRRTPHVDPMLQSFFGSLARYLVLTVTVLAVLSEFGIRRPASSRSSVPPALRSSLPCRVHFLIWPRG